VREQPGIGAGAEDPGEDDAAHGGRTTPDRATRATAVRAVTASGRA
jgi:hypothetical protein